MFGLGKPKGPLKRAQVERMLEESESLAGADLTGLDLTGLEFTQTDLNGARLVNVRGRGVEFSQCELKGASFEGAILQGGEFSQCELQQASFHGAHLVEVQFSQCEMHGAQLAGARLEECEFTQCEGISGLRPEQQFADFSDMEEPQRWALSRERLGGLATALAGKYKEHRDDDEAEAVGYFQQRPYRVGLDLDFGTVTAELRCDNSVGTLAFAYDPQAAASAQDADEWDHERGRRQRVFVAHGTYVEVAASEVAAVQQLLQGLPGLGAHVGGWMPALGLETLSIDAGLISARLKADLLKLDLMKLVPQLLGFMHSMVAQFERGGPRVGGIARVYVKGQPMAVVPRVLCRYCGSNVQLDERGACPSCGAPGA